MFYVVVTPRRQESFRTAESEEMRDVDCCGSEKHLHSATCHVSAVNRVSQDASSSSDLPSKPSLNGTPFVNRKTHFLCRMTHEKKLIQVVKLSKDFDADVGVDALHAEQLEEEMRLADAGVRGKYSFITANNGFGYV